jgi:hypothetical protein
MAASWKDLLKICRDFLFYCNIYAAYSSLKIAEYFAYDVISPLQLYKVRMSAGLVYRKSYKINVSNLNKALIKYVTHFTSFLVRHFLTINFD